MLRKVVSHTAIYGLAPYVPKLLSFFTLPIVTKDLTTTDYGVAGVIGAYSGAIVVFNTLGLRLILVNSFFHYASRYQWIWRQIYGFLSLWVIVFALAVALLLSFVIPVEAQENATMIIVLNTIPLVCFGPVSMVGNTYFQLKQQPVPIAMRTIIFGMLSILLNVYTISVLKLGYMGWFWTECIAGLLSNASYWYIVNYKIGIRPIFNFRWRTITRSLSVSLSTVPHYYSSYLLRSSDRMVMDWLRVPLPQIGRYNLAGNFGNYFNTVATASGLAVNPILNGFYKKGMELAARNLVFALQILFFSVTFAFCLWSKELFYLLIRNASLRDAYPLAIIIIMSYNYRPMYFGCNNKVFYAQKTGSLWRITFVAGVLNVVLNLVFVPIGGIEVAAVTTFVAYMYMGYAGYASQVYKNLSKVNYYPWHWLGATVVLTILVYWMVELSILYKVVISAGCSVLLVAAYFYFGKFIPKY